MFETMFDVLQVCGSFVHLCHEQEVVLVSNITNIF